MRPKAPTIDVLQSLDARRVQLEYSIDNYLHLFPPGFDQEAQYKSKYDKTWTSMNISFIDTNQDKHNVSYVIEGLHPFTNYTVRIRMRSAANNDTSDPNYDKFWSPYAFQTVKTIAVRPDQPPATAIGSFEVVNHDIQNRNVFVYWQQIAPETRNGPGFHYSITETAQADKAVPLIPKIMTNAYALFTQLPMNDNFTFFVTSKNENGTAPTASKLFVPKYDQSKLNLFEQAE